MPTLLQSTFFVATVTHQCFTATTLSDIHTGKPDQYQYYSEASRPHKLLLIDLNHFFKITALIITSKK